MAVIVRCPRCKSTRRAPDRLAGKTIKCSCGRQLLVPHATTSKGVPAGFAKREVEEQIPTIGESEEEIPTIGDENPPVVPVTTATRSDVVDGSRCGECGESYTGKPRFCPNCGKPLGPSAPTTTPQAAPPVDDLALEKIEWKGDARAQNSPMTREEPRTSQGTEEENSKQKSVPEKIASVIVGVISLILLIGWFSKSCSAPRSNTGQSSAAAERPSKPQTPSVAPANPAATPTQSDDWKELSNVGLGLSRKMVLNHFDTGLPFEKVSTMQGHPVVMRWKDPNHDLVSVIGDEANVTEVVLIIMMPAELRKLPPEDWPEYMVNNTAIFMRFLKNIFGEDFDTGPIIRRVRECTDGAIQIEVGDKFVRMVYTATNKKLTVRIRSK